MAARCTCVAWSWASIPISSPERELEQAEVDRRQQRQKVFDDVYRKLRVRETPKAIAAAREWFDSLPTVELQRDVAALLEASRSWSEPKAFGNFAQGLITPLLAARQPGLALATTEEATRQAAGFAPALESDAVALARYAQQTGRKGVARTLLQNFVAKSRTRPPGADLLALQQQLGDERGRAQAPRDLAHEAGAQPVDDVLHGQRAQHHAEQRGSAPARRSRPSAS